MFLAELDEDLAVALDDVGFRQLGDVAQSLRVDHGECSHNPVGRIDAIVMKKASKAGSRPRALRRRGPACWSAFNPTRLGW